MVDIDKKELNRSKVKLKDKICCDAKYFLKTLLKFLPKKINVYGWDFYLESSANNMSYWELFFYMYKYILNIFSLNFLLVIIIY